MLFRSCFATMCLTALHDIRPGEKITFNKYPKNAIKPGQDNVFHCDCGVSVFKQGDLPRHLESRKRYGPCDSDSDDDDEDEGDDDDEDEGDAKVERAAISSDADDDC